MGLWSFVKDAGKKLVGADTDSDDDKKKEAMEKELKENGIDPAKVNIKVDGDKVTFDSKDLDSETREKAIVAIGNTQGVAAVEDKTEGSEDPNTYTVQKGDSLWKISEKTLGNGARYNEIFEINKPMLSDPDKIYPGQVLRIPRK